MRSPLTVIQRKQGNGEHGPPLVMPHGQAQGKDAQGEGHDVPPAEVHDHRQQHAPKPIVHTKAGQEQRQLFTDKIDSNDQDGGGEKGTGRPLFLCPFHRANKGHRQGKGH